MNTNELTFSNKDNKGFKRLTNFLNKTHNDKGWIANLRVNSELISLDVYDGADFIGGLSIDNVLGAKGLTLADLETFYQVD